jgi:hypothetical protein
METSWLYVFCYTDPHYISPEMSLMLKAGIIFEGISIKSNQAANGSPARYIERNMCTLPDLVMRKMSVIQTRVFICARQMLSARDARIAGLEARRNPAAK